MEPSSSPSSCTYHDVEETAKIADYLIQTLAMACIEKTYANLFTSLLSVVDDTKSELLQYVSDQSIYTMPDPPSHGSSSPYHRVKHLLDQFVQSKTKFLSRVSSNVMTDKFYRIRQFSQELQHLDRWRYEERRLLAEKILRSVAVSSEKLFCCLRFDSQEELARHKVACPLRPVICENTGCGHVFSALHGLDHDAICGFKLMPCVQACDAMVMRSMLEMHCETTCPMKLVNCPFFNLGCTNNFPQGMLEEHSITNVSVHLMYLFESSQKQESVVSNLARRMLLIEKVRRSLFNFFSIIFILYIFHPTCKHSLELEIYSVDSFLEVYWSMNCNGH